MTTFINTTSDYNVSLNDDKTFLTSPINPNHHPPVCPAIPVWNFYSEPNAFDDVDKHALQLKQNHFKNFHNLLHELVLSKPFTDLEKARAIFRWVTSQNITKVSFQETSRDSPEEVFMTFKQIDNTSYSRIYQLLCCYSGLYCVNVYGYAKGIDYLPGDSFTNKAANHTWNAVYIDDRWNLVDVHWAMRYFCPEETQADSIVYEYDEFYFLMDPFRAIYSHFPLDSAWQLLDNSMTLKQFEDLPLTKSQFFHSGMDMVNARHGVIHSGQAGIKIALKYEVQSEFVFKLSYLNNDNIVEQINGIPTKSFAILETQENEIGIYLRLPIVGNYYLTIYNKMATDILDLYSNVFRAVCSYKVVCHEPCNVKFPCHVYGDANFGPSWPLMEYYGLEPITLRRGLKHISNDKLTSMDVLFKKKLSTVHVAGKLKMFCPLEQASNTEIPYADSMIQTIDESNQAKVIIQMPKEAQYFLEIYANKPSEGDTYTLVAQYLLDYSTSVDSIPLFESDKEMGQLPDPYQITPRSASTKLSPLASKKVHERSQGTYEQSFKYERIVQEQEVLVSKPAPDLTAQPQNFSPGNLAGLVSPKAPNGFTPKIVTVRDDLFDVPSGTLPSGNFNYEDRILTEEQRQSLKILDQDTLSISKRDQDSFVDLIWQLIYSRDLKDDAEKVRAIFYWLCTKNLHELNFANCPPNSPELILMKIKEGQTTYAEVFVTLCKYVNIQASVVHGYAKGYAFYPGMSLNDNNQVLHAWNVALIDGQWHLFDCHWAARRFVGKEPSLESCMYYLDDFYFMTNPDHLKWTHLPLEQKWQLTNDALTIAEFEKLPPVKSSFFKHGLSLSSHMEGLIECERNCIIKLHFPTTKAYLLDFTFSLRDENEVISENLAGYGMNEIISRDPPTVVFSLRFPHAGVYRLLIYVRETDNITFSTALEYRIAVGMSDDRSPPTPFPPTQQSTYGPTDMAFKFGIGCSNENQAVLPVDAGIVDIRFFSRTNNKLPFLLAQLKGMGQTDDHLSQFVLQRSVKSHDGSGFSKLFTIFIPMPGEFSVEVYANNGAEESGQYFLAWQFLLVSGVAYPHGPIPVLPSNLLGCLTEFENLGLTTMSHPDPLIRVQIPRDGDEDYPRPEADLAIDILLPAWTSSPNVRIISQLAARSADEEKNLTDWVMQMVVGRTLTLLLRFPSPGLYKLHLYGQSSSSITDMVPVVFTYIIEAPDSTDYGGLPYIGKQKGPFPKQSNKWKEGAILSYPLDGLLPRQETVEFCLQIAKAKDVVAVMNSGVTHFEGTPVEGTDECTWKGRVSLPSTPNSKISVCGRWTAQSSNYPTLLEYRTKSE